MDMGGFPREELEEMWQRWLDANATAEKERDWAPLADFYAPDATYGWMFQPDEHFMAMGREEIRSWALGTEMAGLGGWTYPYQATVIDEVAGMVVGFWRQISDAVDEDGEPFEVHGIGGSWFGYGGDRQWAWQRDWFDLNSAAHTFLSMAEAGKASEGLLERMGLHGPSQPGHYRRADLPAPVWPVPTVGRP
jgi:hypothetical protein